AGRGFEGMLGRAASPFGACGFEDSGCGGRGTGRLIGAGVAGFADTGCTVAVGGRGTLRAGAAGCGCDAVFAGRDAFSG
ncbi:MAG: PE family protein, partial [Acidobacteria bacterium]